MSKRQVWQGSHDNLCGLYAAADIIARHKTARSDKHLKYESYFQKAFVQLLKSAEFFTLLTASRIASRGRAGGFTSSQIVKTFNRLSTTARAHLKAVAFNSSWFQALSASERRELIVEGASLITQEDGDRHWIAVHGFHRDGGYFCFDPNRAENVTRREKLRWSDGVLLYPTKPIDL